VARPLGGSSSPATGRNSANLGLASGASRGAAGCSFLGRVGEQGPPCSLAVLLYLPFPPLQQALEDGFLKPSPKTVPAGSGRRSGGHQTRLDASHPLPYVGSHEVKRMVTVGGRVEVQRRRGRRAHITARARVSGGKTLEARGRRCYVAVSGPFDRRSTVQIELG
jgi:hypothetical protein